MRISIHKIICVIILGIIILYPVSATTYVVATDGNDSAEGTFGQPFATIGKALGLVVPNDTIYVRGGRYYINNTIIISKSGTEAEPCMLRSWPGERAILDFSGQSLGGSNRGIKLAGSYWHIEGIDVTGAGDNGLKIESGHYNQIVNCAFYRNRDSGVQMGNGASHNRVINCDSYYNADPPDYGDADGFAAKLDVGIENYFYGCRAWLNCDDGWDGYLRGADNVSTIIENCWAFENGYLEDGTDPGPSANGNGFKMGGSDDKTLRHDYILRNCLAFKNKAKGFDQNSNMGSMILYNCTGHNNLSANYKIYKALAEGEELVIKNCAVSGPVGDIAAFAVEETNSWMGIFTVTDDDFVSLNDESAYGPRKADGSLPDIPYMHLTESSDLIDAGVDVGLPFLGLAPDLGCFEHGNPSTSSQTKYEVLNIKVYPNPANDFLIIEPGGVEDQEDKIRIELYSLWGQKVIDAGDIDISKMGIEINIRTLPAGIYCVSIRAGERAYREIVVVE